MTEDQQRGDRDRATPCAWCGESFRPPKPTGRRPIYCAQTCRQKAYEAERDRRTGEAAVMTYILSRQSGGQPAVPPTVQAGKKPRAAVQKLNSAEPEPTTLF